MKVLIVCSYNKRRIAPFILEQTRSLEKEQIEIDYHKIIGRGFLGYIKNYFSLLVKIKSYEPDIIHAHYGLSGLLANLQRKIPVVTTFHGSDVNSSKAYKYSWLASKLSASTIFVNEFMAKNLRNKRCHIIPCAVETNLFKVMEKNHAREALCFQNDDIIILFSSAFSNSIKNFPLAEKACKLLERATGKKIKIVELKNYSRNEVNLLLNACDCALLTSFSEGSPQFIKEAMACNCPAVTTDVGDIACLFGEESGYYLSSFEPEDVSAKLKMALEYSEKNGRTRGLDKIFKMGLDSGTIAKRIINIYKSIV